MTPKTVGRPTEILLVEDSATDVMLVEESLAYAKMRNNFNVVKDDVEAMAFVRREGQCADKPRPDLILLDLHLPDMAGGEALQHLRAETETRNLPIMMLNADAAPIKRVRAAGAVEEPTKPICVAQYSNC